MKTNRAIEKMQKILSVLAIISYILFNIIFIFKTIKFNIILGVLLIIVFSILNLTILETLKREINKSEKKEK
jgi:hypothetical protein|nr:MAG TPA: cytochrome d ubiquinol oxidase [Caudoviricetes sp.]